MATRGKKPNQNMSGDAENEKIVMQCVRKTRKTTMGIEKRDETPKKQ